MERRQVLCDASTDKVPDAPFKKTWPLLAIKRMVRYAAENGYDSIAWTPGEVQAERYDLSKQVDRVLYWPETKVLIAERYGKVVIEQQSVKPEDLESYVGKDVAKRLLETNAEGMKGDRYSSWPAHMLEGDGLK